MDALLTLIVEFFLASKTTTIRRNQIFHIIHYSRARVTCAIIVYIFLCSLWCRADDTEQVKEVIQFQKEIGGPSTWDPGTIERIARESSQVFLHDGDGNNYSVGANELEGLTQFAKNLSDWYNDPAQRGLTTTALVEKLAQDDFELVLTACQRNISEQIEKSMANKTSLEVHDTRENIEETVYARLLIAQSGAFLIYELLNRAPRNLYDTAQIIQTAIFESRKFKLLSERLSWILDNSTSVASSLNVDRQKIQDLQRQVKELESKLAPVSPDPSTKAIYRLSVETAKKAHQLEVDLASGLGDIKDIIKAGASQLESKIKSKIGSIPDAGHIVHSLLCLEPTVVGSIPGKPDEPIYRLDYYIVGPTKGNVSLIENGSNPVPDSVKSFGSQSSESKIPLGLSIHYVVDSGTDWYAIEQNSPTVNVFFDSEVFRQALVEMGAPRWMLPSGANNYRLSTSADLRSVTIGVKMVLPPFTTPLGFSFGSDEQGFTIELKLGDKAQDAEKILRDSIAGGIQEMEKRFVSSVLSELKSNASNFNYNLSFPNGDLEFTNHGFVVDIELRELGAPSTDEALMTFRVGLDSIAQIDNSASLKINGLRFSPRLSKTLQQWANQILSNQTAGAIAPIQSRLEVGDLKIADPSEGFALTGSVYFDLGSIKDGPPPVKFLYRPFDNAHPFEIALIDWKIWAQASLKGLLKEWTTVAQGMIDSTVEQISKDPFQLATFPSGIVLTARIKDPKYMLRERAFSVGLSLRLTDASTPTSIANQELVLNNVRIVAGVDGGKLTLPPKFEISHATISNPTEIMSWLKPLVDLSGSGITISDASASDDGISFTISLDLPSLGITVSGQRISVVLSGRNVDIRETIKQVLVDHIKNKLQETEPNISQLGPLSEIKIDLDRTQFAPTQIWVQAQAKLWGGINVPVHAEIYPAPKVEKPDSNALFASLQGPIQSKLGSALELNGGFSITKPPDKDFIDVNPLGINLNIALRILDYLEVRLDHVHIDRDGLHVDDHINIKSELFSEPLSAAVRSASLQILDVNDPTLVISLKNKGLIGIDGDFTLIDKHTSDFCKYRAKLRANFNSAAGMEFTYEGHLIFIDTMSLYRDTGQVSFRTLKAVAQSTTEGWLDRVLHSQGNTNIDFKNQSYDESGDLRLFGVDLASEEIHLDLKELLLFASAGVHIPVLGAQANARVLLKLGRSPTCDLDLNLALKLIGIDLLGTDIDVNTHRARLTCSAFGFDVIILVPTLDAMTPEYIERCLASIFHLSLFDFEQLLKRKIVISPTNGNGSNEELNLGDHPPQLNPQLAANATPGGKDSGQQAAATSSGTAAHPASTPASPTPTPISAQPIVVDSSGRPIKATPGTAALQTGIWSYLPYQSLGSPPIVTNTWPFPFFFSGNSLVFHTLIVKDQSIYKGVYYSDAVTADRDTSPPLKLDITIPDLFKGTDPSVSSSLLPVNRFLLTNYAVGPNHAPFILNRVASPNQPAIRILSRTPLQNFFGAFPLWRTSTVGDQIQTCILDKPKFALLSPYLPNDGNSEAKLWAHAFNMSLVAMDCRLKYASDRGSLWVFLKPVKWSVLGQRRSGTEGPYPDPALIIAPANDASGAVMVRLRGVFPATSPNADENSPLWGAVFDNLVVECPAFNSKLSYASNMEAGFVSTQASEYVLVSRFGNQNDSFRFDCIKLGGDEHTLHVSGKDLDEKLKEWRTKGIFSGAEIDLYSVQGQHRFMDLIFADPKDWSKEFSANPLSLILPN
jgi:hypothetical protein